MKRTAFRLRIPNIYMWIGSLKGACSYEGRRKRNSPNDAGQSYRKSITPDVHSFPKTEDLSVCFARDRS